MLHKALQNKWTRVAIAVVATLLYAVGVNLFIVPVGLYSGGVVGLSQVIRTLLARSLCRNINQMPDFDKDDGVILRLFGSAEPVRRSRLQFSDSFIINADQFREIGLTEVKTENAIRRDTSVANPRQIERVVAGVKFGVRIVYDVMKPEEVEEDLKQLAHAMQLLQLDYLGGHGSRGSGRVGLEHFEFSCVEADFPTEQLEAIFGKVENYGLLPV